MPVLTRRVAIVVHRWVGLGMAAFLVVAGSTGCLLAFFTELDAALNPELFVVAPPSPGAPLLEAVELAERVQRSFPNEPFTGVILELEPRKSVNYWIQERETFVDPYTGEVLGTRKFGDVTEGKKNLLTFIYRLHYSLALGEVGTLVFGVVALLWTLDCFVGAYLTFPQAQPKSRGKTNLAWLRRWVPAWLFKTNKLFALVFTWHRASGLWVWGMLLVFAWSGVALNIGDYVYEPVMNALLPRSNAAVELPEFDPPRASARLDFRAARDHGRKLMAGEAAQRGFEILEEKWLFYDPEHGAYSYTVDSSLDIDQRLADTTVSFDGDDGRLLDFQAPSGLGVRNSVDHWLIAIHFGAIREGGYAYRAFVSLCGVLVTLLSVTGVLVWWRKRKKRRPRGLTRSVVQTTS